jgi:hypothetical protein
VEIRKSEITAQTKELTEKTEALNRASLKVARTTKAIAIIAIIFALLLGGTQIVLLLRPPPTTTLLCPLNVPFLWDYPTYQPP